MATNPPPLPLDTPLVETDRQINWFWAQYLTVRDALIQQAATIIVDTALSAQAASIAATSLAVGSTASLYRVNSLARITRAAGTSSSLIVTIAWTEGGVALTKAYAALVANTTSTYLSEVLPIRVDANTSVTYATTYASVGAPTMQYRLEIAVERLQ